MIRTLIIVIGMWVLAMSGQAMADITSEDDLDAYLPREAALKEIKQKIDTDPENHDNYFAYARMADALGRPDQVAWAYDQLLVVDPQLDRVRLDLSLVYISLGRFTDARSLLTSVLAKNPPDEVKQNINTVLANLDKTQSRHHFTGSLTVGMSSDSDANAAPNSGNVLVLDTTVPLSGDATKNSDLQGFTALTLGHAYDAGTISDGNSLRWVTSGVTYLTQQQDLSSLDLQLYGVRTGPEITSVPLGTKFALTAGYNYILLDNQSYLRDPLLEFTADFPIYGPLRGFFESQAEYRKFLNARTVTTYSDRAGQAVQSQLGLRYFMSERALLELIGTLRREAAKQDYYANDQMGAVFSGTYGFAPGMLWGITDDMFTVGRLGYKQSRYDMADTLISNKPRIDSERNIQLVLGRKFIHDIVLSAAYSYTDVLSNLENYRYDNHRYTLSLTKNF